MPTFVKNTSESPSRQLKSFISLVSTHFKSFERSDKVKVRGEFDAKRLSQLRSMPVADRVVLGTCAKGI